MFWDKEIDRLASPSDRAKGYRARAAELRAIADSIKDASSHAQVLITAAEYERMADAIEKLADIVDRANEASA